MVDVIEASDDPIQFSDVLRFLEERTPNSDCPSCGAADWTVLLDKDGVTATEGAIPLNGTLQKFHPMILLSCQNCGHMNLYHRYVFDRWLADNQASEPGRSEAERAE